MKPFFDSIHSSKDSFFNLLSFDASDSMVNKTAAIIGEKQVLLDLHMYRHLKNVRELCTPEQLPKFDSLFKNVVAKMTQHFRKPGTKAN